ncbi:MAG: S1 RNA-binding domain-containing protein [Clostridia bacterium]|nr:S1 RNA-binding domain-containing protein [Clostridia bacterium]
MSFEVGSIVEGKVSKVMPFGAFISLPGKKSGLVHISEVARDYVENINDHVKEGDDVKVKVVKIDDDGKISLSIKQALEPKKRTDKKTADQASKGPIRPADIDWSSVNNSSDLSFDDMLNRFKQDSDEKMQALKRSNDSKRSGGYRRGGGSY